MNGTQDAPKSPEERAKGVHAVAPHFSFGSRRYASNGPRRLFTPQKGFEIWMLENAPECSESGRRIFLTSF